MVPQCSVLSVESQVLLGCTQVLHRAEELERRASIMTAEVMVVGAGPAGVELASTVAERLGSKAHVQLVSAGPALPCSLP